jgi:hypothetical protein
MTERKKGIKINMPKGFQGFQKGNTIWLGKSRSKENIEKIRKANTGKKHTEETKEKLRQINLGKVASEETKLKMRLSHSSQKGELNNNWKGGITPLNNSIRNSKEYRQWRIEILKRDNFTCTICFIRGGKLHADHILSFSKYPELRFKLENGRTVCLSCHEKIHNRKLGHKIPIGRYHITGDTNPKGLFHDLSYDGKEKRYKE